MIDKKPQGILFVFIAVILPFSCSKDSTPNQPPEVSIITDATDGNAPFTVNFTAECNDPDGECVEYEWDFGDGSEHAFSSEAVHTYTAFGEYTAKLTVKDNAGEIVIAEQVIKVSDIKVFYPADGDKVGWWEPAGAKILVKAGGRALENIEKMEVYLDGEYLFDLSPYGGVFQAYWWTDLIPDGEHKIYAKAKMKSGKVIVTKENKFTTHNSIDVGREWISSDFQTNTDGWQGIDYQRRISYIQVVDLQYYPQTGGEPGDMAVYIDDSMSSPTWGISSCLPEGDPGYTRIHVEAGQLYELSLWWWMFYGFGLDVSIYDRAGGTVLQRTLTTPSENTIEFLPQKTQVICIEFVANGVDIFLDDIRLVRIY